MPTAADVFEALLSPEANVAEIVQPIQPYDLATILSQLSFDNQLVVFGHLDIEKAAETLEYLEPDIQYQILKHLKDTQQSRAVALLHALPSDIITDLMLSMHPNQSKVLLDLLPPGYRQKIDELMTFPEDTAGSLATVDYIAARENWTISKALEHLRGVGRTAEIISYLYVVDTYGRLVNVVSVKELILADPSARLSSLDHEDLVSVSASTDQEAAAKLLAKYDLVAVPVVAENGRLIGIITVDDVVDVLREEATEDIHRLGGSEPLEDGYFETSIWEFFSKRVGWLLLLFLAEAYTGTVLQHFQTTLHQVVALSLFIPLLISTGGNTGSQTVSILVRSLGVGDVRVRDIWKVIYREFLTSLLLGVAMAGATYVRAWTLGVGVELGPVVALTGLFIVVWSAVVAGVLPLVLYRLKMDPAVVSTPLISTLVDGTGLIIYFETARIMLGLH